MKKIYILLFSFLILNNTNGQTPERELRASWLSYLDWPSSTNVSSQKQQMITILDGLEAMNMNAVFFHVRAFSDAYYNSAYEPWASYLTGTRGQDPGYDPLEFIIDEAHKRGIEVHAWMNPYRATSTTASDCSEVQSSWLFTVNNKTYYNPGVPEVTTYITNLVSDIMGKYEVDGFIFDDYFYPEGINNEDAAAFSAHGNGRTLGDFRRESVNAMIAAVNTTIKNTKSDVRFGVSPFGIYANSTAAASHGTTVPSGINGWDVYNTIYCDALAWLEEGSVDYLSPQLYWSIDNSGQNYDVLTEWWGKECKRYGRHCYPSLGVYRLFGKSKAAETKDLHEYKTYVDKGIEKTKSTEGYSLQEFVDEINVNRANEINNVYGAVLFRNNNIFDANLDTYLKDNVFQNKSLYKELDWLTSTAPTQPTNVIISQPSGEAYPKLTWTGSDPRYAVFGVQAPAKKGAKSDAVLLQMVYSEEFSLEGITDYDEFAVAGMNNKGELSIMSATYELIAPSTPTLISPLGKTIALNETFSWNQAANATSYIINIYDDENLTNKVFTQSNLPENSFQFRTVSLEGQQQYFWEIVASNAIGTATSVYADFTTGYPSTPAVSSPANNATGISPNANVTWDALSEAESYFVQISRDPQFSITQIVVDEEVTTNSYTLDLLSDTEYYLRIYAKNTYGKGKWSSVVHFTTEIELPEPPTITAPSEGQFIDETSVTISWDKVTTATGYKINIANDSEFATVIHEETFDPYTRSLTYTIEYGKKYYTRVASAYNDTYGDWSATRYFTNITPDGIEEAEDHNILIYPNPVKENIFIRFSGKQKIQSIEIYSITGSKVLKQKNITPDVSISVKKLSRGIYQGIITTDKNERLGFRILKK